MYLGFFEYSEKVVNANLFAATESVATDLDVMAKQSAYRNCANSDSANPSSTSEFSDMSYSLTRRCRAVAISS